MPLMEEKQLISIFYFFLLYIILTNSFSDCKEGYKYKDNSNDLGNNIFYSNSPPWLSSSNENENDLKQQIKSSIEVEEKKVINPGEVQKEILFKDKVYTFNFNSFNYSRENDLLIQFYPLDCNIKIVVENENEDDENDVKIEKIKNYEYDAFYTIIQKDKLDKINFKIRTLILINSFDDYNKNRTYYLIINSFEYINNSNLIVKEKEPTFLNFNNTIDKINLLYYLDNKKNYIHPISISFFIKEKVKFEIIVSNNEDKTFKKIIAYTDRILIDSNFIKENSSFINIHIEKIEKEKDAIIITKIIGDYSSPIYFQRNILNLGFIPENVSYQYYYMEVFNGEEGEIMLNSKRYKGKLISTLIPKGTIDEYFIFDNSEYYPKEDKRKNSLLNGEYLEYNEYSKKMSFNSFQTNSLCENGCYLLLTYYSIYLNKKTNDRKLLGTEFTLLSRIFDEENEFRSQIINIPLNEYIFGLIETPYFNIHYYSLYIPENTNEIIFEMNFINAILYVNEGVNRFSVFKSKNLFMFYGPGKMNFKPDNFTMSSFGGKFITLAISNLIIVRNSNYYFRILTRNSYNNKYLIYPLDTIIPSVCETEKINEKNSCFFLIDNIYKDLYNDVIIYADGKQKIQYIAWFEENSENDYYSIDLENLKYENKIEKNHYFLKIDDKSFVNSNYILIDIQSENPANITIFPNFYDNITFFPSIQIYSYQLMYLNNKENFTLIFEHSFFNESKIFVNNVYGNGEICFDKNCIDNSNLYERRILTFSLNNETNSIDIYSNPYSHINNINNNDFDLLFIIKFEYGFDYGTIKELQFNSDYKEIKSSLPIAYFLKEIQYKGVDINFYFNVKNLNKSLSKDDLIIIKGYFINDERINSIKYIDAYDYGEKIEGKFDDRTNNGLLVFDKEMVDKKILSLDDYYLIIIDKNKDFDFFDISFEMHISSKDSIECSIPINKYIYGSFNLKNSNQSQRYYINDEQNGHIPCNDYIIEFSSNYKDIELLFNNPLKEYDKIINGGIYKYFLNINFTEKKENYFVVQLKDATNKNETSDNDLKNAYYILKYYPLTREQGINYIFNITHDLIVIDKENSSYVLKIKNKYDPLDTKNILNKYELTYILNIYIKQNKKKNELINTVAPIDSDKRHSTSISFDGPIEEFSFYLDNIIMLDVEYDASIFIKIKNKIDADQISYYSYAFNIFEKNEKKEEKDDNKLAFYLIIGLLAFIIIIIIVFYKIYRNIKNEKKELEQQVQRVSFSRGSEDDEEKTEDEKSFI